MTADAFSHVTLPRMGMGLLLLMGLCLAGPGCGIVGGEENGGGVSAPTDLTGESGDGVIRLRWSGGEAASSYNVYRDDRLHQEGVSQTRFEDAEVKNGTTYTYAVTAVGGDGTESDRSDPVTKTPFSKPPDTPDD
jgi:fibronectin type 3 domain-containing protein